MSTFRTVIYCPDCYHEDYQGCFDGGAERLDEIFTDKDAANEAGWKYIHDTIWKFWIEEIDNDGNKVKELEAYG